MIELLFFVSNLIFLDLGIFDDISCFNVCVTDGIFKSCFQQSAKSQTTAQTLKKHHVFSQNSTL